MIKSEKFPWGKVIENITLDFDGQVMEVVKYHPRKRDGYTITKEIDSTKIEFCCEEINQSGTNIFHLVLAWIAYKHIGSNQNDLVAGIIRALKLDKGINDSLDSSF